MSEATRGTPAIRNVYADTLDAEFELIRAHAERYRYVAMDTEFPGVVVRPVGHFHSSSDFSYQILRSNVDLLRLIQLGLTFADDSGELAEDCPTWQFNFRFSLEEDVFAADSIALLQRSGLDFASHQEKGIEVEAFGELLMSSGLVLCDNIKWISFHSIYDFAYLIKLLTNTTLPAEEEAFTQLLNTYFPTVYDVKHLLQYAPTPIHGGLQRVGEELKVARHGQQHQAGSDSLMTSAVFFQLKNTRLGGKMEPGWTGLYGLPGSGSS